MHLFYLQQDSPVPPPHPSHTPQVPNCSLAYETKDPYVRLYSLLYSLERWAKICFVTLNFKILKLGNFSKGLRRSLSKESETNSRQENTCSVQRKCDFGKRVLKIAFRENQSWSQSLIFSAKEGQEEKEVYIKGQATVRRKERGGVGEKIDNTTINCPHLSG